MKHPIILFAIAINIPLLSAELCKKNTVLSPENNRKRQETIQSFNYAINFFDKENKKKGQANYDKAGLLLLSAYQKAEDEKAIGYVSPIVLQKIYSYISITQTLEGNIDEALIFADKCHPHNYSMMTNKGHLYTMKAEQQGDTAESYRLKAFESFSQAAPYNEHAWQVYEDLLYSRLHHNPTAIAQSLFKQLPYIKDTKKRNTVLHEISQLDHKDEAISVSLAYKNDTTTDLQHLYKCVQGKTISFPLNIHALLHANQEEISSTSACIKKIKLIDPSTKRFKVLYKLHGYIIEQLLLEKRKECTDTQHILYKTLSYLLGICAYSRQDYNEAYTYLKDSDFGKHDLLVRCLMFEAYLKSSNEKNYITTCFDMLKNIYLKLESISLETQPKKRDDDAKKLLATTLINFAIQQRKACLEEANDLDSSKLIYYMLTYFPETYDCACELFSDCLLTNQKSEEVSNYQRKIRKRIIELAQEKDHRSTYCKLAGSFLLQDPPTPTCLSLLLCTLSHHDMTEETSLSIKKICSELYCNLDNQGKSIQDLDKIVALHNPQAIREKAEQLSQQPNAKERTQQIRELLLLHTKTHDSDASKALSYNALALSLESSGHPKDKTEVIHYVEQAIALGNHDCVILLGQFCESDIQTHSDQILREKNLKTACELYTQHIEYASSRVDEAFLRRAFIHYKLGNFSEAYQDFVNSYKKTNNLKQQAISLFMQCLTNIQMEQDENLYPQALQALREACQKIDAYLKSSNLTRVRKFNIFIEHMDEKGITAVEKIMTDIINTNNTSKNALDWCDTMGYIMWESVVEKPLDNPRRKNILRYLIHAADKNLLAALFALIDTDDSEICKDKKLTYINNILIQLNPDEDKDIIALLKKKITILSQPLIVPKQLSHSPADITGHLKFPLLMCSTDCTITTDKQYVTLVHCMHQNLEQGLQKLKYFIKKRPAIPHGHLLMAIHCIDLNDSEAKNNLITALNQGIIEKNKRAFFKDWFVFDLLCELINACVNDPITDLKKLLVNQLKNKLAEKKINITAFEEVIKDLCKYDLTKNPDWQKK